MEIRFLHLRLLLVILASWGLHYNSHAQVTIGDKTAPHGFSVLELSSKTTKGGLRLPHLTTDERDDLNKASTPQTIIGQEHRGDAAAIPVAILPGLALGLTIYNTDTNCIEYWDGYKWVSLCLGSASIELGGYPPLLPTPPDGGELGPYTPAEKPKCTQDPPYDLTLAVGTQYASAYFLDQTTGQFMVSFSPNPTAKQRLAIARLTNNCTGEYKEFAFTQEGANICDPAVAKPDVIPSATNVSGEATICGDQGSVILAISNATYVAGKNYIWMLNDIQQVGSGQYIVANIPGSYKVYVGGIGCESNVSDARIVRTSGTTPDSPQIVANNGAIACGGNSVTLKVLNPPTAPSVVKWYKNGLEVSTGNTYSTNAGGDYFAVIDDAGCHSNVSEVITIKERAGSTINFTDANVEINGLNVQTQAGSLVFCDGGVLNMKIVGVTGSYVYRWKINGAEIGTGATFAYKLSQSAGATFQLSVVAETSVAGECPAEVSINATIPLR